MDLYQGRIYSNQGLSALLQQLEPDAKRILDIGCGAGDNARLLGKQRFELHGLTLSEAEAKLAKPHFESVTVANVEHWTPSFSAEYFDAIVCSHVIEHVVDPLGVLRRLMPLLKRGGFIYLAAPNVLFWKQRWEFLRGRFQYTEQGILDRTHLRFFTPTTLRQLVEQAGFNVAYQGVEGHLPLGVIRRWAPQSCRTLDLFACRWAPGFFGFHILIKAQKPRREAAQAS